jgi:hypothetical protein
MGKTYDVAKNPSDGKWYVIGNCGGGYWMPVSDPLDSKKEAQKHAKIQVRIDRAEVCELLNSEV